MRVLRQFAKNKMRKEIPATGPTIGRQAMMASLTTQANQAAEQRIAQ